METEGGEEKQTEGDKELKICVEAGGGHASTGWIHSETECVNLRPLEASLRGVVADVPEEIMMDIAWPNKNSSHHEAGGQEEQTNDDVASSQQETIEYIEDENVWYQQTCY